MKNFITFIFIILINQSLIGQNTNLVQIVKANTVYFYGYDFTHFKHVEPSRIGQDAKMKGFIFELIQWMNDERSEKVYKSWLRKDSVIFDQAIVNKLNSEIKPENIIGIIDKHTIPLDSLQRIVDKYDRTGKSGIGFVLIMECFYKLKKETSMWHVFFAMQSGKILDSYESHNTDADSYHGLAAYWGVGVSYGMARYSSEYYRPLLKKMKSN